MDLEASGAMSRTYHLYRDGQPCVTCGRDSRVSGITIGLSSEGWSFLWQGWRTAEESPFGIPVLSAADWLAVLGKETASGAVIKDSYGRPIDLVAFFAHVKATREPRDGVAPRRHSALNSLVTSAGVDDIAFYEMA